MNLAGYYSIRKSLAVSVAALTGFCGFHQFLNENSGIVL